jgi:hypothetical protein
MCASWVAHLILIEEVSDSNPDRIPAIQAEVLMILLVFYANNWIIFYHV